MTFEWLGHRHGYCRGVQEEAEFLFRAVVSTSIVLTILNFILRSSCLEGGRLDTVSLRLRHMWYCFLMTGTIELVLGFLLVAVVLFPYDDCLSADERIRFLTAGPTIIGVGLHWIRQGYLYYQQEQSSRGRMPVSLVENQDESIEMEQVLSSANNDRIRHSLTAKEPNDENVTLLRIITKGLHDGDEDDCSATEGSEDEGVEGLPI